MIIIPIGIQCTTAMYKRQINITSHTYPFDWMFSSPLFVYEILQYLLLHNMNIRELVENHFFNCDRKAHMHSQENYYTHDDGFALYNTKYNVIFPHDHYSHETIDKYIRRFERLKYVILHTNEKIYFTYTSQSSLESGNFTINGHNIIHDVYGYLSKIHDLISIFRLNFKIVLFDSIQNEPVENLNGNIILCRLNRRNCWEDLLGEMNNYRGIFTE